MLTIPVSPAALQEIDPSAPDCADMVRTLRKQDAVIRIAPFVALNDWVVIIPFNMESTILLSAETEYRNVGIVVGKSDTRMAPDGSLVPSCLDYGDVVLFQKKSVVGEMAVTAEPYAGRRLIILSERNVMLHLPSVPFEILDVAVGAESFPDIQPDHK